MLCCHLPCLTLSLSDFFSRQFKFTCVFNFGFSAFDMYDHDRSGFLSIDEIEQLMLSSEYARLPPALVEGFCRLDFLRANLSALLR